MLNTASAAFSLKLFLVLGKTFICIENLVIFMPICVQPISPLTALAMSKQQQTHLSNNEIIKLVHPTVYCLILPHTHIQHPKLPGGGPLLPLLQICVISINRSLLIEFRSHHLAQPPFSPVPSPQSPAYLSSKGLTEACPINYYYYYRSIQLSLCENWPLENKVPMRSPYAFYPGVALR